MYVEITPEIIEQLNQLKKKTGVGAHKLLRGKKDRSADLSGVLITSWMTGKLKKAKKRHLDYVLDIWSKEPVYIEMSTDYQNFLKSERDRTGLKGHRLLTNMVERPDDLSVSLVSRILNGGLKKIKETHLEAMIEAYKNTPDLACSSETVPLDKALIKRLMNYRDLGVLPSAIFEGRDDAPMGLDVYMIGRWFNRKPEFVNKEYLDFVLTSCESMENDKSRRVKITPKILDEINMHKERTGIGPKVLFDRLNNVPDGLNYLIVSNWINQTTSTAQLSYVNFVIDSWKKIPTKD